MGGIYPAASTGSAVGDRVYGRRAGQSRTVSAEQLRHAMPCPSGSCVQNVFSLVD
jgi:hypothetical protein